MATQRYISTSFWDDEWIQTLDPSEKLLYLYLMTNPLTNIAGVYKITDRRIGFDTGFNLDTIRHIFGKFEKAGKAYRKGEYVILPNWPKHQMWEKSKKIELGIAQILKELDSDMISCLIEVNYRYPIHTLSIPYPYRSNYLDLDLDRDIDKDNKRERGERSGERTNQTNQRFAKPSLEQLALYASSISYSRFDAQRFFDFYESKGWVVGKSPMKDWKAAVRNWRKRDDITQRDGNDRFVGQESADTTQEMMG